MASVIHSIMLELPDMRPGGKGWGRNSSLQTFSTQRRKYNGHLYKQRAVSGLS